MASLKDMRNRLASTKATQKITKAMQMVAASKVRRAQAAAEVARPMRSAWKKCSAISRPAWPIRKQARGSSRAPGATKCIFSWSARPGAVCAGRSTRRSCGSRASRANALMAQGKDVKFLCVGRKGFEQLRRLYERQIIKAIELRSVRSIGFENAHNIAQEILALFDAGEFDVCTLFFSRFRSVIQQIPTAQQIIPAVIPAQSQEGASAVYEYEPDEEDILAELLPRYVASQVFRALLENAASFYGAQMTAMDNATRNAGDMIKKQTLTYNRTRQAMITKELIEIISGAEAL